MSDPMNQSTDSALIAASKVEGKAVFDAAGEKLGTVKELYLDKRSGEVEFASLAFGGVLGVGEKYHPVPWQALDFDTDKDGFVVDLDKSALESSPSFDDERLSDARSEWGTEVRGYYADLRSSPTITN
jgi:sporulation protein YlmC with PRC-barrel domain